MMKVLFVGLGGIGQRHLRNIVKIMGDSVDIYAYRVRRAGFILDNKLNIIDQNGLERKYHIHVLESLEQAWEIGMQCVFICNPSSLHMEVLLQAVPNGCHVFVEKPLSHNYNHIEKLEQMLSEKQIVTFVGYQNRFHPCIKKAKELLRNNVIGRVVKVSAEIGENVKTWHKYEDYRSMYACRKELGGGVVLSQIHELDYIISFFGMPESVYAVGGKLSNLDIDVEDVADILMKYRIGGIEVPVSIREDYLQNPPVRNCKIIGTDGRIQFDLLKSKILLCDANGKMVYDETYQFERNDMFLEEMNAFLSAINGGNEKVIPIAEGIKSLKVALAVKQSMESGMVVDLQENQ